MRREVTMIDRAALPTIGNTLQALGAQVRGKRATGVCHGSTTPGVISFNDDDGLYYCHRCAQGGDVLTLVQRTLDTDFKGACQWLGLEPWRPPAPDPEAIRRQKARTALQAWARKIGRELRDEFFYRTRIEYHGRQRLMADPEDRIGWTLLEVAYSGMPLEELEDQLDAIDTGSEAQLVTAYRQARAA
jgi:hypothetical protein